MIAAMVREFPSDYEVTFWVFLGVMALLAVAGGFVAWGRGGGGRRG